jgi:hypothetical protein
MGLSLEAWFRSQLTPNQKSPTTVIHQRIMLSESRCLMRQMKNWTMTINLARFINLLHGDEQRMKVRRCASVVKFLLLLTVRSK